VKLSTFFFFFKKTKKTKKNKKAGRETVRCLQMSIVLDQIDPTTAPVWKVREVLAQLQEERKRQEKERKATDKQKKQRRSYNEQVRDAFGHIEQNQLRRQQRRQRKVKRNRSTGHDNEDSVEEHIASSSKKKKPQRPVSLLARRNTISLDPRTGVFGDTFDASASSTAAKKDDRFSSKMKRAWAHSSSRHSHAELEGSALNAALKDDHEDGALMRRRSALSFSRNHKDKTRAARARSLDKSSPLAGSSSSLLLSSALTSPSAGFVTRAVASTSSPSLNNVVEGFDAELYAERRREIINAPLRNGECYDFFVEDAMESFVMRRQQQKQAQAQADFALLMHSFAANDDLELDGSAALPTLGGVASERDRQQDGALFSRRSRRSSSAGLSSLSQSMRVSRTASSVVGMPSRRGAKHSGGGGERRLARSRSRDGIADRHMLPTSPSSPPSGDWVPRLKNALAPTSTSDRRGSAIKRHQSTRAIKQHKSSSAPVVVDKYGNVVSSKRRRHLRHSKRRQADKEARASSNDKSGSSDGAPSTSALPPQPQLVAVSFSPSTEDADAKNVMATLPAPESEPGLGLRRPSLRAVTRRRKASSSPSTSAAPRNELSVHQDGRSSSSSNSSSAGETSEATVKRPTIAEAKERASRSLRESLNDESLSEVAAVVDAEYRSQSAAATPNYVRVDELAVEDDEAQKTSSCGGATDPDDDNDGDDELSDSLSSPAYTRVLESLSDAELQLSTSSSDSSVLPAVDSDWHGREWNARFQRICSTMRSDEEVQDAGSRRYQQHNEELLHLSDDFIESAKTYGRIIIAERYLTKKTIAPLELGGEAGGAKYVVQQYVDCNLIFCCCCCSLLC
jgi:hypothetical protein